LPLINMVAKL